MQFRCSALLFDLDGVLVDSRAVVERTCRRWALRHQLDPDEVLRIAHGRRTRDTVKAAAPHLETDREAAWIDAVELADIDELVLEGLVAEKRIARSEELGYVRARSEPKPPFKGPSPGPNLFT